MGDLLPLMALVGIDQRFVEYALWRNRAVHRPRVSWRRQTSKPLQNTVVRGVVDVAGMTTASWTDDHLGSYRT